MNTNSTGTLVGEVCEIRRYPVKSMLGQRLDQVTVGSNGLSGDRQYAVIDTETGRVASAKKPHKWGKLLELQAELRGGVLVVTKQDGTEYRTDRHHLDSVLSKFLERPVTLGYSAPTSSAIEMEWPNLQALRGAGKESIECLLPDSYFDVAPIHLLTTATLDRFRQFNPACAFESHRFRPNLLVKTLTANTGFVEQAWVGKILHIGTAQFQVMAPCSRCIMTTVPQRHLPADHQVLQTVAAHNAGIAGIYLRAEIPGEVGAGDLVWLSE